MQSKKHSAFEVATNIIVGWTINMSANFLIFPLFGWSISLEQNVTLGCIYTVIAIIRGYILRRIFNKLTSRSV